MLVLAAPTLAPIDLDDTDTEGFICQQWNVGPPDVREVVEPRTLADGTIDRTAFIGARAVNLTVIVFPAKGLTVQGQIDRLRAFCRPSLRPTLTWRVEADEARTVTLRAAPGVDQEWNRTDWSIAILSFVVPDGLIYAGDWTGAGGETRIIAPSSTVEAGRRYDEVGQLGPAVPQNLFLSDNAASVESGNNTGLIGAAGATITNSTAQARHGTHSVAMTATSTNPNVGPPGGTASIPVAPNTVYTMMSSVWVAATGRQCYLAYSTYDAAGAVVVNSSPGTLLNLTAGQWTDLRRVIATGNDASAFLRVWVSPRNLATDGSETAYIDRLGLFGGDVPGDQWALPSEGHPGQPTGLVGRGYDRKYPPADVNNVIIVNPGDIAVPWVARIYGPCVNPALYNDTTGQGLVLSANGGLTLDAGESVVLDSRNRTITVDGVTQYTHLDVTRSSWWSLVPGDNTIRFAPAQFSGNAQCEFTWRHAWL
jgi:Siphovirus-type tail component, C-terminal domain